MDNFLAKAGLTDAANLMLIVVATVAVVALVAWNIRCERKRTDKDRAKMQQW